MDRTPHPRCRHAGKEPPLLRSEQRFIERDGLPEEDRRSRLLPYPAACGGHAPQRPDQPKGEHERDVLLLDGPGQSQDGCHELATELWKAVQAGRLERTGRRRDAMPPTHVPGHIRRGSPALRDAARRGVDHPGPFVSQDHRTPLHAMGPCAANELEPIRHGIMDQTGDREATGRYPRARPAGRGRRRYCRSHNLGRGESPNQQAADNHGPARSLAHKLIDSCTRLL